MTSEDLARGLSAPSVESTDFIFLAAANFSEVDLFCSASLSRPSLLSDVLDLSFFFNSETDLLGLLSLVSALALDAVEEAADVKLLTNCLTSTTSATPPARDAVLRSISFSLLLLAALDFAFILGGTALAGGVIRDLAV